MKKIVLFLILMVACGWAADCNAQGLFEKRATKTQADLSAYMEGAVPEVDGKVVFSEVISAPGKDKVQLMDALASWANLRYMPNTALGLWNEPGYYKNLEYAAVTQADRNNGVLTCNGYEEQVFSNRVLAKDYTVMNYTLTLRISDAQVEVTMSGISYLYAFKEEPEKIAAEDWITDKECIKKKGGFYKASGKFRIKTIDVKNAIFDSIKNIVGK